MRTVAVVGAGHVGGMKKNWHADVDVDELVRVPQQRARSGWLVVGLCAGAVVAGVVVVRHRRKG